jgi:hypothetical protein
MDLELVRLIDDIDKNSPFLPDDVLIVFDHGTDTNGEEWEGFSIYEDLEEAQKMGTDNATIIGSLRDVRQSRQDMEVERGN